MSLAWEVEELACVVCGKSEEETEQVLNDSLVDDILYEKYEIDFETYYEIVKDLLPLTPVITTALTETRYHAFVFDNRMVARMMADDE